MGVAVGNMIKPFVNKEFHIMIQNRMRIMSLAVHLQFYCCFCAFSCAISTQTLPCLKCRSFDRSICIGPFSVSFKRSQPAFVLGIKFTLHCKCSFPFDLLNSFKTQQTGPESNKFHTSSDISLVVSFAQRGATQCTWETPLNARLLR